MNKKLEYRSAAAVAQRIKEWLGKYAKENTASLLLYEAMQALERAQHAGEAEKPAEFEIRVGGIHMAGASGPRELVLQEAQRYFRQYAFDATEDEPVQLVEVIEVASAPVAAMSATPSAGEKA